MADVFSTEEYEDAPDESNETTTDDLNESSKENSDMTLKQEANEFDVFAPDELLVNPDDLLPPVAKLEKYADSNIVFNRQVVARNLLETLRLVHENSNEVDRVIDVLGSISEDYDPSVRTELMVQLPHIAAFCKEMKLNNIIVQYLVPMLLSYLRDENNLVRKSSHSALLSVLEQGLIDFNTQTEKIWPLILHMTESINPEEIRTESILLMSKLVVLMGAEEQFFERLFSLCIDRSNNVRKACASTFGDICTIVGREMTEEILLPKFFTLCEDGAWCVRKACAENFMPVSCVVSREVRCKELSSLYMVLLSDHSRWVRVTAYQALGPFISTFAEPDKTGLYYSKDGVLTIVDIPSPVLEENSEQNDACNSEDSRCNGDIFHIDRRPDTFFHKKTSKLCDSELSRNCTATSQSHTPPSDVPSISCHVGNYCTVIEVSSPASTTNSKIETDNAPATEESTLPPVDQQSEPSGTSETELDCCNTEPEQSKTVKLNGLEDINRLSEEQFIDLWCEATYGCKDNASGDLCTNDLNGDIDAVYNKLYINNKNLQNIATEDKASVFHSSITINGMKYSLNLDRPLRKNCVTNTSRSPNSLKQSILNNLLKGTGALSNLNLDSINCSGNGNKSSEDSLTVNTSQDSNCSECESAETENVLKPTSDKPLDKESAFNNFQYWREPIPPIEIKEIIEFDAISLSTEIWEINEKLRNVSINKRKCNNRYLRRMLLEDSSARSLVRSEKLDGQSKVLLQCDDMPDNKGEPPPDTTEFTVHDQDIVPPELLLQYLSMIDSDWAQTVDAEIARHCAYSLPAVALTLGRKYWPCLKETFDALTSDLQGIIMMWKVRRTVASAMHQLAVILGPDITSKDLLPVFSRFITDLNEVRVGILQHLYDFLKLLRPEERLQFLPSLPEFLVSNSDAEINEKNWRFRLILAEQLVCIADLYEPQHVRDHLVPLSLTLIKDKVCEVRLAAVRVMAAVMRRMTHSPTQTLSKAVLNELTEKFVHSRKWLHRQLYVYVCQEFIVENSLSADQFAEDALPQLLFLCWDRVPNVRLAIARCLVTVIWPLDTFSNPDSPHRELLLETIHTLQSDVDADVRYYVNMVPTHECSCLQNGDFNSVGDPFV